MEVDTACKSMETHDPEKFKTCKQKFYISRDVKQFKDTVHTYHEAVVERKGGVQNLTQELWVRWCHDGGIGPTEAARQWNDAMNGDPAYRIGKNTKDEWCILKDKAEEEDVVDRETSLRNKGQKRPADWKPAASAGKPLRRSSANFFKHSAVGGPEDPDIVTDNDAWNTQAGWSCDGTSDWGGWHSHDGWNSWAGWAEVPEPPEEIADVEEPAPPPPKKRRTSMGDGLSDPGSDGKRSQKTVPPEVEYTLEEAAKIIANAEDVLKMPFAVWQVQASRAYVRHLLSEWLVPLNMKC